MKNMLCLLLAALLAVNISQAQTNLTDNTSFRHIPADADQVFDINLAGLIAKADVFTLMKSMQGQNFGGGKNMSMLKDIFNAGVDLRKDLLIAQRSSPNPDSAGYLTIIAHLTDSSKFGSYIRSAGTKQDCAFSDKLAVVVIVKRSKGQVFDPATGKKDHLAATRRATAALRGFDHSFYITDEKFKTGFSDDADIHIWNHGGSGFGFLSKLMQMTPAAASPHANDFSQFMKKAHKANTLSKLRFESGKLVFQTTRFLSGDDSAGAARFMANPIGDKLLSPLPSGKVLGLMAMHFDLSSSLDNLRKYGMDKKVDSALSTKGLTTQDVLHAFSGDFLFVANVPDTGKKPLLYGALTIGDKTAFDKVAVLLKPAAPAAGDTTPPKKQHLFLSTRNDIAVISGSQANADAWFNNTGATAASRLVTPEMRSNTIFIAIDFQVGADLLTKLLTKGDTIAAKDQKLLDMIRHFDSFVLTAPSGQHGATTITYELNFTDRDKNALASIMELAASAAKAKNGN